MIASREVTPDNVATINVAVVEGSEAIHEAVFAGTHTETFHLPDGQDIPPTGKRGGNPLYAGPHLPRRQVVKLPAYLRPSGAHEAYAKPGC